MFPKVSHNSKKKKRQMYKLYCSVIFVVVLMSSSITDVYKVPTVCLGLENRNINRVCARKSS